MAEDQNPNQMPPKHLPAYRYGVLADDGDTATSQHTALAESVNQHNTEAMDTSPDASTQTQSVSQTNPGTTDAPTPTEETQSDELSDDAYLGSDLSCISVIPPPRDEANSRTITEETRQVPDEVPLISREEAQLVTADNVDAFFKSKLDLLEQRSKQKKLQDDASKPTEGSEVAKTMADIRRVEAQNLTEDEHRLIVAYRNAGRSVRVSIDGILGLMSSSETEEGALPSEGEEEQAPRPIPGKRSHPFEDEAVTKKARVSRDPAALGASFDVSQSDFKARGLDHQLSEMNHQASFDFARLVWPQTQPRCIVQINDGTLIGDLRTDTHSGISPRLYLDPARTGSPRISISFDCPGTHGREVATMTWYLDDYVRSEWVINSLVAKPLSAVSPSDLHIYNPDVINRCPQKSLGYLHFLGLKLNPYTNGYLRTSDPNLPKQTPETEALRRMFNNNSRYDISIWFLTSRALQDNDFESRCLAVFTDFLAQRQTPFDRVQDSRGVRFKAQKYDKKAPYNGPNPRVPVRQMSSVPASLDSGRSHGAAATSRVGGAGSKPGKIDNVRTYAKPVPSFGFQFPIVSPSSSGGKLASTTRPSGSSAKTNSSPAT